MAFDYDKVMALPPIEAVSTYSVRDTILYALGLGAGSKDPLAPSELQLVFEQGLKSLPTMAVVLGSPGFWPMDPIYGFNWKKLLHGEQMLELHKTLPLEGRVKGILTIDEIYDKGTDKGALLYATRKLYNDIDGELLATLRQCLFLRADGGFGGTAEGVPKPHSILVERPPDVVITIPTRVDQALIYRLSGDNNPLHVDPEVAETAGFPRPILHGLCTYGIAGLAVIREMCGGDPQALRRLDVRFSQPVFPGDTLQFEFWRENGAAVAFTAMVPERDVMVLNNGYAKFHV